jgi:hypothetical protein
MIRSSEEILADIDATLDQLIENADVLKRFSLQTLFVCEVEALQKTQESLLARLVHMNDLLKDEKTQQAEPTVSIERKIMRFGKLNAQMIDHVSEKIKRMKKSRSPRIRANRKKVKV